MFNPGYKDLDAGESQRLTPKKPASSFASNNVGFFAKIKAVFVTPNPEETNLKNDDQKVYNTFSNDKK